MHFTCLTLLKATLYVCNFREAMNALIILLCGAALAALYYIWTFNYWKRRGIKSMRPNLLLGNIPPGVLFRKIPVYRLFKEVYVTCKQRGDKCMGFYFLQMPALVVADHELAKQIYAKEFSRFTDRPSYFNNEDPLTVHIGSAKGNRWKKMREQLSPAFSPSKLKSVCRTLLQTGDQLKSVLDKSAENCKTVDLTDVSSKFVVDAIGSSVFGIECNTLKNLNMEFKKFAENTFGGSVSQNIIFLLSLLCPSVLEFFKIPFNSPKIQNFYLNLVKTTVEYREKNHVVRSDLMHSIIQLRNNINIEKENNLKVCNVSENEKALKIEEITAQVLVFFGAAYESSSSTICLCLYELALNEDIQNNLRQEIANILKKNEGQISYDAIMEMTYLDKCISETLRKYAIASMMSRTCTERYKVPDTDIVINVGDSVYIPAYEFHHDPEYYPNPDKFDPERFSPEIKSTRPSYTFLSFGEGPRNCIGSRLGLLQIKIFLVTFLSNYNFTINSNVKLPMTLNKSSLVVTLENPLCINIEKI